MPMPIPGQIPNGILPNGQSAADNVAANTELLRKKRQEQIEINKGLGIASGNYGDALPPAGGGSY